MNCVGVEDSHAVAYIAPGVVGGVRLDGFGGAARFCGGDP
jgi:hypothetical protein